MRSRRIGRFFFPSVTAVMTEIVVTETSLIFRVLNTQNGFDLVIITEFYFSHKSHFWVMTKVSNEHKTLDDLMIGPDLETQFSNFVWFLAIYRLEWNNHLWFEVRIYPKMMLKIH